MFTCNRRTRVSGDDRERDRLGDQREGHDQAREDLGAPDLGVGDPVGLQAAQARGRGHSGGRGRQGRRNLSCSGTPVRQAGACGRTRRAGPAPRGRPRACGAGSRERAGVKPARGRSLASPPGVKPHGGQAAAPGVMGSHTRLSCKESDLRRGRHRPRHGGRLSSPHRSRRRPAHGHPPYEAARLHPGPDARPAGGHRPSRRRHRPRRRRARSPEQPLPWARRRDARSMPSASSARPDQTDRQQAPRPVTLRRTQPGRHGPPPVAAPATGPPTTRHASSAG